MAGNFCGILAGWKSISLFTAGLGRDRKEIYTVCKHYFLEGFIGKLSDGSHSHEIGKVVFFHSVTGRDRSIFVGVGWDRTENPLPCHPLPWPGFKKY